MSRIDMATKPLCSALAGHVSGVREVNKLHLVPAVLLAIF